MNDIHVISYDSLFSGTLIIKYLITIATEHYLENVFSDTYAERRHKSACESVQSEQTFFSARMKKLCILGYRKCAQWSFRLDSANPDLR